MVLKKICKRIAWTLFSLAWWFAEKSGEVITDEEEHQHFEREKN